MSVDTPLGRTLGDYRLLELVGSGRSGVVYRATQLSRDRTVAVKLIGQQLTRQDGFSDRVVDEVGRLNAAYHGHLVTMYGVTTHGDGLQLVMRYLSAEDLGTTLAGGEGLDYQRATKIISEVADGLAHAHDLGLVHRGLTPRSILVEGGKAYLGDFAITAETADFGGVLGVPDDGSRPAFDYVAPEQIDGRPADSRTDVYGLACVYYEAVTGATPFKRYWGEEKLEAHLTREPARVTEIRPDLPHALDELFARALAKNPDDRFSSPRELALAAPTKSRVLARWKTMRNAGTMGPEVLGEELPAVSEPVVPVPVAAGAMAESPDEAEANETADANDEPGDAPADQGPTEAPADARPDDSGGGGRDGGDGPGSSGPEGEGSSDSGDGEGSSDSGDGESPDTWGRKGRRRPAIVLGLVALAGITVGGLAVGGAFSGDAESPAPTEQAATPAIPSAPDESTERPESKKDQPPSDSKDEKKGDRADAGPDAKKKSGRDSSNAGSKGQGAVAPWPTGTSAYTAVVFASATDRAGAEARAQDAAGLGLRSGVLQSSDYPSLQPGVWVAFAGIYDSEGGAEAAVSQLREAGVASTPYVRFIGG